MLMMPLRMTEMKSKSWPKAYGYPITDKKNIPKVTIDPIIVNSVSSLKIEYLVKTSEKPTLPIIPTIFYQNPNKLASLDWYPYGRIISSRTVWNVHERLIMILIAIIMYT